MLLKLMELKKQNLLRKAFLLESNEFEVLEFYGDAFLYERVTKNIIRSRRFMDPHLMTNLRVYCIKNANLAVVFDQLGLEVLFEPSVEKDSIAMLTIKNKADIVEAIIGEIAEHRPEEDVLSELVAFISYIGEKEYFKEHNNHANEPSNNSSKNSKRIPRNDAHHRHHDHNYNHSNQKDFNSASTHMSPVATHSASSSLPQSPKDPAPVYFLQNAKPSKTSPAPPSIMDNFKILKRGTEMNPSKPGLVIPPHSPSENFSSEVSTSPPPSSLMKPSPPENVFFGQSRSPSWVPNIASTRNGMDLKT
jgi:dsRNA-specific ribonuclease